MSAREVALQTVRDVMGDSRRAAQGAFGYRSEKAGLDARDSAFAGELAYGSIKMRRLLDWYLKPYVGERRKELPPTILEVLRLGIYQLRMMRGVEPHAAVHETVNLALRHGHRGTAGLVNAVLRRFERDQAAEPAEADFSDHYEYLGTRHSLPTWLVKIYAARFGPERLEAILEGINRRPQLAVTVNTARADLASVIEALGDRGLTARPSEYVPEALLVTGSGASFVGIDDPRFAQQSESAAMPVDLLDPRPGERVIEYCAGRGNKTLQIAARQHPRATVEAVELDARRSEQISARMLAGGLAGVAVVTGDARFVTGGRAEAILVDAPCSATGILGRRPEARWRKEADDGARLALAQEDLLRGASLRLEPGGRLLYSVCSVDRREGEAVVEAVRLGDSGLRPASFPERYREFRIADGMLVIPPGIAGRDGFFLAGLTR